MIFKPNKQYDDILNTLYLEMGHVYVNYRQDNKLSKSAIYGSIKKWKPTDKTPFLKYLIQVIDLKHNPKKHPIAEISLIYDLLTVSLFKSTLGLTENDLKELLTLLNTSQNSVRHLGEWPITHAVNQITKFVKNDGLSESLKSFLESMLLWNDLSGKDGWFKNTSLSKSREKIDAILFEYDGSNLVSPEYKLSTYDKLGAFVNNKIDALGIEKTQYWHQLFHLAEKNSESPKPTKKYLKESAVIIQNIGEDMYYNFTKQIFNHMASMKDSMDGFDDIVNEDSDDYDPEDRFFATHDNTSVMKGLVWTMMAYNNIEMLNTLAALAERCFKKAGIRPASVRLGNACILVIKNHAEE